MVHQKVSQLAATRDRRKVETMAGKSVGGTVGRLGIMKVVDLVFLKDRMWELMMVSYSDK